MPEKDNNKEQLHFAGRDIDPNDFVRYSQAGINQYMVRKHLSEDQKQDVIQSLNEVLPGIVNGTYSVSDFGKIQGGISASYSYDSNGKRKFGGEQTFNPYQFVETYLNGIAGAMKQPTSAKQDAGKKKWSNNTLYNRLTGSIFGSSVPGSTSELAGSEQFLNWANQYDPYDNKSGKRTTSGRSKFIADQLAEYRNDIVSGLYNLTDADKEAELKRIDQMMGEGGLNPHSLGTLAPWLGHLLFTENAYKTAEQQEAERAQTAQQNFINFGTNVNPGGSDYTINQQNNEMRLNNAATILSSYQSSNIVNAKFDIPFNGIYSNETTEQNLKDFYSSLNQIINSKTFNKSDKQARTTLLNQLQYNFYNKYVDNYGKGYTVDWDKGIVHIINKNLVNKTISIQKVKLSDYFNSASDSVKLDLANQYINFRLKGVQSAKSGGILKASGGQELLYNGPDGDEDDKGNKPTETPISDNSSKSSTVTTTATSPKPELDEYVLGSDGEVPGINYTPDTRTAHSISNPYDKVLTALELQKYGIAKSGNIQNYWTLSQLKPNLKWANRTEYKTYTPVEIERQMAWNEARFNNLGAQAASETSSAEANFAKQLASHKALTEANNPLAIQKGQMTNTTIENSIKNENQNNQNQYDVSIGNHTAMVAAHNKQLTNKAELTKRNADLDVKRVMAEQYGIASGAEQAYNEDMYYAIENDPEIMGLKQDYLDANKALSEDDGSDPNRREELRVAVTKARQAYNEAVEQAATYYKREHKSPIGVPFVPPITRYYAKGGKTTLEAEREKTRRAILKEKEKTKRDYLKMFNDMLKQQSDHSYKRYRSAYDYYRKLMMQSN